MKINWKDFGITLLLLIIVSITVYRPFDFSFVLVFFIGELFSRFSTIGSLIYALTQLLIVLIPSFFSSLILVFYIWRNKQSSYKEIAIVSFLIPVVAFSLFYIYAVIATIELPTQTTEFTTSDGGALAAPLSASMPYEMMVAQHLFLILSIILLSVMFSIFGLFWKFVIGKIPIQ